MILVMIIGRLIVEDVEDDDCYAGTTDDHELSCMGWDKVALAK